ncbi:MAG TPA: RteC domain-containing protein [Parasegetibacter sp.]
MKAPYDQLFLEMLVELTKCEQSDESELKKVESCFVVATRYWEKLKELCQFTSNNAAEEIYFFRHVKPLFIGRIRYYTILYEALLCIPDKSGEYNFWEEEAMRLERFCERHEDFIKYLQQEPDEREHLYFLREHYDTHQLSQARVFDADPEFCTQMDHILSAWIAEQLYHEYTKKRLAKAR